MFLTRSEALNQLDVLHRLTSGLPWSFEAPPGPLPVVAIDYSDEFKFVLGVFHTLNEWASFAASSAPNDSDSFSSSQLNDALVPTWLIALAFAIQRCPPHYSAWKLRRDVIVSPRALWAGAVENARFFMKTNNDDNNHDDDDDAEGADSWRRRLLSGSGSSPPAEPPMPANSGSGGVVTNTPPVEVAFQDLTGHERAVVSLLLPRKEDVFRSDIVAASEVTQAYSPWKAVRWELKQCLQVALTNHKNFQIWHHRKELIAFAIQKTGNAGQDGCDDVGFTSESDVVAQGEVPFSDIDERIICDDIFKNDSKNYHVWLHRSWFISAFPFLHASGVEDMCERRATSRKEPSSTLEVCPLTALFSFLNTCSRSDDSSQNTSPVTSSIAAMRVLKLRVATLDNGGAMPRGIRVPGALQREIDYTSRLIREDVFNNSAWSYRMLLIKEYVIKPILSILERCIQEEHSQRGAALGKEPVIPPRVSVLDTVCCFIEDICVAELSWALSEAAREVCNECPFVYARGVCEGWYRDLLATLSQFSLDLKNSNSAQLVVNGLIQDALFGGSGEQILTPTSVLLHCALLEAMDAHIAPIVREVQRDVKDPSTPYGCRSGFILNNTHQYQAARFHLARSVCECLWVSSLTAADREHIHTVAPPQAALEWSAADFVAGANAIFQALFLKVLDTTRATKDDRGDVVCAAIFLAGEYICLMEAKALYTLDAIRLKYWRHAANITLHRSFGYDV